MNQFSGQFAIPANLFTFYRGDIFYLKSAKIFHWGPIISEDVLKTCEDVLKSSI